MEGCTFSEFLDTGSLPDDEMLAKLLVLSRSQYLLQDGILYYVEPDSMLRIIPPAASREKLFQQAHRGCFGDHLGDVKVYRKLRRHYWWEEAASRQEYV